ncbi:hypothetical protein LKE08_23340, partial [Lyngbya sp. CCY1209]|nr:hypothetical protein [Lyngbya sp. CCY1209]
MIDNPDSLFDIRLTEQADSLNILSPAILIGDFSVSTRMETRTIEAALTRVKQNFSEFTTSPNFEADLKTIFGEYTDVNLSQTIIDALHDDAEVPEIVVVSADLMNGANGGFDSLTGTVYLSDTLMNVENTDVMDAAMPSPNLVDVLTEELGHYIDSELNEIDSPGDEGELLMRLVRGDVLSSVDATQLKYQDDRVQILGGLVEVEANLGDYTSSTCGCGSTSDYSYWDDTYSSTYDYSSTSDYSYWDDTYSSTYDYASTSDYSYWDDTYSSTYDYSSTSDYSYENLPQIDISGVEVGEADGTAQFTVTLDD